MTGEPCVSLEAETAPGSIAQLLVILPFAELFVPPLPP